MKKIVEYELPAYWASCLVNRDFEHSDPMDALEAQAWLDAHPQSNILACSDSSFIGRYNWVICDMLVYTLLEG